MDHGYIKAGEDCCTSCPGIFAAGDVRKMCIRDRGYSVFYGQTDSMQKKWSNLKKIEDETFLKIILGTVPIEEFDTFVENWYAQGGTEITQEVTEAISK